MTLRRRIETSMSARQFRAAVSSDWSECLSPNGPFDPISFTYPELESELIRIFKDYTGNVIALKHAVGLIAKLLPQPLSMEQMDAYLDANFRTYTGVQDLIERCLSHDILFMLNTTGTQGYFQRAITKGLIPPVPVVAANPMIRYPNPNDGRRYAHQITEIDDKATCSEAMLREWNLSPEKLVVMGDSGGDGPHFKWAASAGAYRVANMAKQSLQTYCKSNGITINTFFGLKYGPGESRDLEREMNVNFMDLTAVIEEALGLHLE
jgi:2-hydroxy-3-keto-5-methylthiopentenyl-1-phosphate phosphatase